MTANTTADDSIDDSTVSSNNVADGVMILGGLTAVIIAALIEPHTALIGASGGVVVGVIVGECIGTYVSG